MTTTPNISPTELGERLRIAREMAKVTQESAAKDAGLSRTTLVAIEKGQRSARIEELQSLSRRYGVSVNSLLRREAVHIDLVPRFRRFVETGEPGIEEAANLLNELVSAEVELENMLGIVRARNYPPGKVILPGDVRSQAEQDAHHLRHWLGLGDGPIQDVFAILELQLGVRVYVRKLDPRISGLFAYDEAVGACVLINARHRRDRRTQSAAHELGHLIAARTRPEVYQDSKYENSRDERYAIAFGSAFLTPARTLMQKFEEITAASTHLTRRHIILLSHFFGVSRQAMVHRLEDLSLTKKGTWAWFEDNGGITDEQEQQVLGGFRRPEDSETASPMPMSMRLYALAAEAWKRDLVSEGQLSDLLKLDRVELRSLLEEAAAERDEADNAPKLPA